MSNPGRNPIPIYDATQPVTCTIAGSEVAGRVELLDRMRANLRAVERTEHGMLLHFPDRPDVEEGRPVTR